MFGLDEEVGTLDGGLDWSGMRLLSRGVEGRGYVC